MAFTGNEDHTITIEEASKLTANYRKSAEEGAVKAEFFAKATLQDILNQGGCVGIRIYYGQDSKGTPKLVLVGVDTQENDLTVGAPGENGLPCPPFCGVASALNS